MKSHGKRNYKMSNEGLTIFCTILALVTYSMALPMLLNWGRYDKFREELSKEQAKTYGLELDLKYLKKDIESLEKKYWEIRK